jgi:hypothetical protein
VDYHEEVVMETKLAPVHPGEVLLEEFLEPTGLSQYRLAKDVSVAATYQRDRARQAGRHR